MKLCHCGGVIQAKHFAGDEGLEDVHEAHQTRCCNCTDSWLMGDTLQYQGWACIDCMNAGQKEAS